MRDTLYKELKLAFDTDLKDAVKSFVLSRVTIVRDKRSDTNIKTETTHTSRGIFSKFEATEADGVVTLVTDTKLLLLQDELDVIPRQGDYIGDYRVVAVSQDPVEVSWVLALRKTNGLES